MNPQWVQAAAAIIAAYAALMGGMYAVITRPIEGRFTLIEAVLKRIEERLTSIETKLDNHSERITRLEAVRWK